LPPDGLTGVWRVVSRVRDVAARHVKIVALLGLIAVIIAVWLTLKARSWTVEAAVPVVPAWTESSSAAAPTAGPASAVPAEAAWLVHVLGAVVQPGLVTVPAGARVADALAAAGGLSAEADPAELNLAAELSDGCQIIVGTQSEPKGEVRTGFGDAAAIGAAASVVNLNAATAEQLETLPGVGPVTAASILAWRADHGRFADTAELQEISGIGAKTYEKLAPYVRV
jgi:competence protein ComEA